MNENLLKVVDALINDDETMASEYLRQAMVEKMRDRMGLNESVLVFGYAKMHQNKSKNINIISNEIIKYANDNNEESLDVLDNFKNFDNLNKNKQTEYINIIKPLINQYGQSAIFFIEENPLPDISCLNTKSFVMFLQYLLNIYLILPNITNRSLFIS